MRFGDTKAEGDLENESQVSLAVEECPRGSSRGVPGIHEGWAGTCRRQKASRMGSTVWAGF